MVGHTHEDIDQVFSHVSTYLKKNSVYTDEGDYCTCLHNLFNHKLTIISRFEGGSVS